MSIERKYFFTKDKDCLAIVTEDGLVTYHEPSGFRQGPEVQHADQETAREVLTRLGFKQFWPEAV